MEERGKNGEERRGKGERERDKQQWGEKPADGLPPFFACDLLGQGPVFDGTRN